MQRQREVLVHCRCGSLALREVSAVLRLWKTGWQLSEQSAREMCHHGLHLLLLQTLAKMHNPQQWTLRSRILLLLKRFADLHSQVSIRLQIFARKSISKESLSGYAEFQFASQQLDIGSDSNSDAQVQIPTGQLLVSIWWGMLHRLPSMCLQGWLSLAGQVCCAEGLKLHLLAGLKVQQPRQHSARQHQHQPHQQAQGR